MEGVFARLGLPFQRVPAVDGLELSDADLIKLETSLKKCMIHKDGIDIGDQFSLYRLLSKHLGTCGYIVSKKYAKYLTDYVITVYQPLDIILFCSFYLDKNKIYQIKPALCLQECRVGKKFVSLLRAERKQLDLQYRLRHGNFREKIESQIQTVLKKRWRDEF